MSAPSLPAQRVTLITLGVADLARARAFYARWGWVAAEEAPGISFYDLGGFRLALFGLADLAADQGRPGAALGRGAVTLAINYGSAEETDRAFDAAVAAGATPVKRPQSAEWGGHSGYVADPDGHVWELAFNPFWPLDAQGRLLPPG